MVLSVQSSLATGERVNGSRTTTAVFEYVVEDPIPASGIRNDFVLPFDRGTGQLGTGFWINDASGGAFNGMGNAHNVSDALYLAAGGGNVLYRVNHDGTDWRAIDFNNFRRHRPPPDPADPYEPGLSHLTLSPLGTRLAFNPAEQSLATHLYVVDTATNQVECDIDLSVAIGAGQYTLFQHGDLIDEDTMRFSAMQVENGALVPAGIWELDVPSCTIAKVSTTTPIRRRSRCRLVRVVACGMRTATRSAGTQAANRPFE